MINVNSNQCEKNKKINKWKEIKMKLTSIKVKKFEEDEKSRLLGVATAVIDNEFIITDIKIIRGDNRLFLAMPSEKMPDGTYKDVVHPLNTECRQKFESAILKEYTKNDK